MRVNILTTVIFFLLVNNAVATNITNLILKEKDGVTTANYPLTFGHVFKRGDVPQYVTASYDGTTLTTQCDVKTTYDDGSVRFAIISIVIPNVAANSAKNIVLSTSTTTSTIGHLDKTAILDTKIEDEIRLTNLSGSGYTGNLTADLNATISSEGSLRYWLQGPVTTEILISQKLNNSLEASWEVRYYPGTSFGPRISHSIENMNADYRGIVNYNVDIQSGMPMLASKYSKSAVQHNENSRWRKVLWIGPEPPETELHYDLPYLITTGAIMNYDTSLIVSESTISSSYSSWLATDRNIMGNGFLTKYFPQTGGRPEIGMLPTWTARYLLTWDNRMREATITNGEMASHCPVHYRESNASKSFYRHPISIDDRPTVWTEMDRADSYGNTGDKLPAPIGLFGAAQHGWSIDHAHQGSFAYIPYIITGDRYFLDEMYYWAMWDLSACDYSFTWGRKGSSGILSAGVSNGVLQTRGVAWGFRNIVDAAALASNSDIEKAYLNNKISNMITEYSGYSTRYPLKFWNYHDTIDQSQSETEFNTINGVYVTNFTSPWMNDFLLLAFAHGKEQGYDTSSIMSWFSSFIINRFTASGFNHFNGAPYHLAVKLSNGTFVQDWNSANQWALSNPSSLKDDGDASNYSFIAMAAASTVTGYANGQAAYDFLKANVPQQSLLNIDPTWGIVPKIGTSPKPIIINIKIRGGSTEQEN